VRASRYATTGRIGLGLLRDYTGRAAGRTGLILGNNRYAIGDTSLTRTAGLDPWAVCCSGVPT
jgi:hypothetical protein